MIIQFSATKSFFAKYFGMKDFLHQLEITLSSIALPHRILHSDMLNFSVCLLMWENRWVEKDTFAGKKKFSPATQLFWDTILRVTCAIQQLFYSMGWVFFDEHVRPRRGSRVRAALKWREQGLEGAWKQSVVGWNCLFSGSFITVYARSHTSGVRPMPFPWQGDINLLSHIQSLTLGFVFSGTGPCLWFVRVSLQWKRNEYTYILLYTCEITQDAARLLGMSALCCCFWLAWPGLPCNKSAMPWSPRQL